jgi:hypothetical protein
MKTIGIAQPTYLPWLGYFDGMDQVDEFVLLDNVQFERHSWQHRNRVKGPQGVIQLVVPVRRSGLETLLCDAEIADTAQLVKHRKTIEQAYARAAHRAVLLDPFTSWVANPPERLVELTIGWIEVFRELLGIVTPVRLASALDVHGSKDDLVRSICETLGADAYLAAPGSRAYMETGTAFVDSAIRVQYHEFECVEYEQLHGPFLSHLSAADALMCLGTSGARDVMLAGRRPPLT